MKPECSSVVSMQANLEKALFRVVRARSRFAGQFYSETDSAPSMVTAHMPDLTHILHSIEEDVAIRAMAEVTGMSLPQAEAQISQTCTEILEDSGFPYLYNGTHIEALRADFLRMARICYLVGFEAGSSSQCEMFADIVDIAIDELDFAGPTLSRDQRDIGADKILAAMYFSSVMEEGAHSAEYHTSAA